MCLSLASSYRTIDFISLYLILNVPIFNRASCAVCLGTLCCTEKTALFVTSSNTSPSTLALPAYKRNELIPDWDYGSVPHGQRVFRGCVVLAPLTAVWLWLQQQQ